MDNIPNRRRNKLIKEKRIDVYREEEKWTEPTLCVECGALFSDGRWSWKKPVKEAHKAMCPACRRKADNYPAGYIEIKGEFFHEHREEIVNLIHHVEKQEKERHPLERIMSIKDEEDHTLIMTTGVHVARRVGEALSRSYKGDFSFQYADGDKVIRVFWQR